MKFPVSIEGFEGDNFEVEIPGVFSSPKLKMNGNLVTKKPKSKEMVIFRRDGSEAVYKWKSNAMGLDVPSLVVDGKIIQVVKPLKWYEWVWCGLPVLLVFAGGLLGAILGVIGAWFSVSIFRSGLNRVTKFVVVGIISVITIVIFFVVASYAQTLIRGMFR